MSSYNNNNENIVSTDISSPITDNNNNMSELKSPKSLTPLIEQKLRNIAPAPQNKSEYDVYHIPKGYEVLLVPKTSSPSTPSSSSSTDSVSPNSSPINAIPLSPASSVSSCKSTKSCSSSPSSNSSWRKRKNNGHIPRPKNCFMAYREQIQHKVLEENPGMNNKLVSVIAAKMWNEESEETKQYWRERAQQLKLEHMIKYPDYKFAPKKKQSKNSHNNNNNNKLVNNNNSKVIKKSDSKILTEELAKNILNNNSNIVFNDPEDITAAFNNRTPPLLWSHYRSTSTDSISSWASDSSAPSTPPYIELNSPSLLPTTTCPSFKTPNYQNNYLHPHDFLECSSSPLHYTTTAATNNTTTGGDEWNKIISSFEDNFLDTLLPAMEFDQSMQIDDSTTTVTSDNGNYYLNEDDDLEYNEFNEGFFNDPSSQLLNPFVLPSGQNPILHPHQFQQEFHQQSLY
ncbi:hypothetical protein Glove_346g81 [Diversispora epigaea]|uniref:HMG box domain-containing protein n=1 Tax=Diversispora epigaea TaxID=1348612 RepID=A0A397HJV5_9GLOM|nr:hypothetical protein Glove_346g81 [Diversispora epigaea]